MSTNNTPGNASSFRELVEADKRSILEKLLDTALPKTKSTNASSPKSNGKNGSTIGTQASEYDSIFGEDIDDGDEVFEDILKRAREEFEKKKELKKKQPKHQIMMDIFKKPAPKRARKNALTGKTRAVGKALTIMDEFKKKMMDATEPSPQYLALPTITSSDNNDLKKFKSSVQIVAQGNQLEKRPYPTWKATETYTPVFSVTTNPNWANPSKPARVPAKPNVPENIICAPVQNKFYTPGHIDSWMEAVTSSHFTEPPSSCKSIRSDVAVHDSSDSDEDSNKGIENSSMYFSPNYKIIENRTPSIDCKTPPKNTSSSTPIRSTTVRFRPSPPEYFVYGSDGNSSISSDPIFMEEYENNVLADSPPQNYNQCYHQGHTKSSSMMQNSPISLQNEYSPPKENIEYEEHHHYFSSGSLLPNKILKKGSNDSKVNKPRFVEDFVRQLNHNITNNYNMEVKCSMKVKYYK